ncbi:MAG TPA: DUF1572 family protein [Gemmatimonadales bacterium]|nr:DUF1572 family protein [Gemmatimonadales bacterium]
MDIGAAFLAQSREYLSDHYLPKILAAVDELSDQDLWWRPNETSNSAANLILHLSGNVRQWIVSGVGGAPDRRERDLEFSRRDPMPRVELTGLLRDTIRDAVAVIGAVRPSALGDRRSIQGREVTVLEAIYHVVEHFSTHVGQIVMIAKQRAGRDLGFYRMEGGELRAAWPGHPTSGSA